MSRRGVSLAAVVASGIVLAACGGSPAAASKADPTPPPLPLARAFAAAGREWALVPMGDLHEEANTFWQVIVTRSGSEVSDVTPKGVADNGGLVAATAGSRVVIGFPTSELLGFSPLAASSDGGDRWAPGTLTSPLEHVPSALGAGDGRFSALVGRGGARVETSAGGLSGWHVTTTRRSLASRRATGPCGVAALTAVTPLSSGALALGASCRREGVVGLYRWTSSGVRSLAGRLPSPLSSARAEVVSLSSDGSRMQALVLAVTAETERLMLVSGTGRVMAIGPAATVPAGDRLLSVAQVASGGLAVLVAGESGHRLLFTLSPRRATGPVMLPRRSEAVMATPSGLLALSVERSTLRVDRLRPSGGSVLIQTLRVPIEYGSSS